MAKRTVDGAPVGGPDVEGNDATRVVGDSRSDSTVDAIDSLNGIPFIDPAGIGGNNGSGGDDGSGGGQPAKRGRGRPAGTGSGRKPTQKETQTSVNGIEKLLFSLHGMVAAAVDVDELKLDKEESRQLAEGIGNVAQHYAVEVNPKVLAWAGLAGIIGAIYGPRIVAIRTRKALEKKGEKKETEKHDNVTAIAPFNPNFGQM